MTTASTTVSTMGRRAFTAASMFLFTFAIGTTSAVADAPVSEDWPVADGRSTFDTIVFFGGGTVGLIILVALFGLLTARTNYVPPPPSQDLATTAGSAAAHH